MIPHRNGRRAHRRAAVGLSAFALAACLFGFPAGAGAQGHRAPEPHRAARLTVAPVPAGHWIFDILDAAAVAGLTDGWLPGRRPASGVAVLQGLDDALAGGSLSPAWRRTLEGSRARLLQEFGLEDGSRLRASPHLGLRATDGPPIRSTSARPDATLAGVDLTWRPAPGLAIWADPTVEVGREGGDVPLPHLGAAWEGAGVRLEASHGALRFGAGGRGGVVAGGEASLLQLGAGLSRPWRPGGWLRFLGLVDGSFSVSRFGADDYGPAVGFLAAEVRVRPAGWLLLQAQRSAVVAWSEEGKHPSAGDFAYMLIGKHTRFDDQRFALGAQLGLHPFGVAVSPYMELGIEDSAGMLEDPGVVLGVLLPSLPVEGVPVSMRYEYGAFGDDARVLWSGLCCFEPRRWYRHSLPPRTAYRDGDGDLLGHPLGGYGHEHLVQVAVPLLEAGLWLEGTLFAREREEGNLLFDLVPGESRGGALGVRLYVGRLDATLGLVHENGEAGWSRTRLDVKGRLLVW